MQIFVTHDNPLHVTNMNQEMNINLNTIYIHFCIDNADTQ
jgi:hypothetical protein